VASEREKCILLKKATNSQYFSNESVIEKMAPEVMQIIARHKRPGNE
jgi:hypothetical protein